MEELKRTLRYKPVHVIGIGLGLFLFLVTPTHLWWVIPLCWVSVVLAITGNDLKNHGTKRCPTCNGTGRIRE